MKNYLFSNNDYNFRPNLSFCETSPMEKEPGMPVVYVGKLYKSPDISIFKKKYFAIFTDKILFKGFVKEKCLICHHYNIWYISESLKLTIGMKICFQKKEVC